MANGNYEHVKKQNGRKMLEEKLRKRKQSEIACMLKMTQPAVCRKIKTCNWSFNELYILFGDKDTFTNDEILMIMGRSPDDSNKKMANYLLGKIDQMLTDHLDNKAG